MDKEITVKVDAELLDKVMKVTQFNTLDDAIEEGLQIIAYSPWLEGYWKAKPPHMRPEELKDMFYPDYDPDEPYGFKSVPAVHALAAQPQ